MSCCDKCKDSQRAQLAQGFLKQWDEAFTVDEHGESRIYTFPAGTEWAFFYAETLFASSAPNHDSFVVPSITDDYFRLSIYRKGQGQFDELEAMLTLDRFTGKCQFRKFTKFDWEILTFGFTYKEKAAPSVKKFGPGMYRVRSIAGVFEALELQGIPHNSRVADVLSEKLRPIIHHSRWPVMLLFEGKDRYIFRCADVIEIPGWKDDSVWQ